MAIKFTNDLRLFQPLSDKDPAAIGQGDRTMLIPIVHQILANPEGDGGATAMMRSWLEIKPVSNLVG